MGSKKKGFNVSKVKSPTTSPVVKTTKHLYQIDILKGLAITSVIIIHTAGPEYLVQWKSIWNIWQAVPVFFIISGLTLGISIQNRRFTKLRQFLSLAYLRSKLSRILIPFSVAFLITLIVGVNRGEFYLGWKTLLGVLPITGPGNYYISIALQFILVGSLVGSLWTKWRKWTPLVLIGTNLAFELLAPHVPVFNTHPILYSYNIFRALGAIGLGLYISQSKKNWLLLGLGIIGSIFYLFLVRENTGPIPFKEMWGSQNIVSEFYPLLIVLLFLKLPEVKGKLTWITKTLSIPGKASYHIFLVQTLAFGLHLTGIKTYDGSFEGFVNRIILKENLIWIGSIGITLYFIEELIRLLLKTEGRSKVRRWLNARIRG